MKAKLTSNAATRVLFVAVVVGLHGATNGQRQANTSDRLAQENQESEEQHYEWSVWSPCSRTCGTGIQFRGKLCMRENRQLCVKQPRNYQTCNTQECPPGSASFRDAQCSLFNRRDIFINGQKARWISYMRGDNQCSLFCYPYGEELYYYFGKAKDGTPCSKEPNGVCVRGRCKSVGCDKNLESGVVMDKCRICGGNSSECKPFRGRIQRLPAQFEKMSGYAKLVVIPQGSTSVLLTDSTWNYLAVRRQNGEYVVNGHRIINWSGWYSVGGVELKYRRSKDNFKETIEIFGPTSEDVFVTSLLTTGRLNASFEYWRPIKATHITQDEKGDKPSLEVQHQASLIEWGSWTACSASCGGGIKVRARGSTTVSSFRGGETEVKKCNVMPCNKMTADWSEWGRWDDCSASCGGGARIRFRSCKKPRGVDGIKSRCSGQSYALEQCNVQECPTEGSRPISSEVALSGKLVVSSTSEKIDSHFSRVFQSQSASGREVRGQEATIKQRESSITETGVGSPTSSTSRNSPSVSSLKRENIKSVSHRPDANISTAYTRSPRAWVSMSNGGDKDLLKTSLSSSKLEDTSSIRALLSLGDINVSAFSNKSVRKSYTSSRTHSTISVTQEHPGYAANDFFRSENPSILSLSYTVQSNSSLENPQITYFPPSFQSKRVHVTKTYSTDILTPQPLKNYQLRPSKQSYLSTGKPVERSSNAEGVVIPYSLQTSPSLVTVSAFSSSSETTDHNPFVTQAVPQSFSLTRKMETSVLDYINVPSVAETAPCTLSPTTKLMTPASASTQLSVGKPLPSTRTLSFPKSVVERSRFPVARAESSSPSSNQRTFLSPSPQFHVSLSKGETASHTVPLIRSTLKPQPGVDPSTSKSTGVAKDNFSATRSNVSSLPDVTSTSQNFAMAHSLSPLSSQGKFQESLTVQWMSLSPSSSKLQMSALNFDSRSELNFNESTRLVDSSSSFFKRSAVRSSANASRSFSTSANFFIASSQEDSFQRVTSDVPLGSRLPSFSRQEKTTLRLETSSPESSSGQPLQTSVPLSFRAMMLQETTGIGEKSVKHPLGMLKSETEIDLRTSNKGLLISFSSIASVVAKEENMFGSLSKDISFLAASIKEMSKGFSRGPSISLDYPGLLSEKEMVSLQLESTPTRAYWTYTSPSQLDTFISFRKKESLDTPRTFMASSSLQQAKSSPMAWCVNHTASCVLSASSQPPPSSSPSSSLSSSSLSTPSPPPSLSSSLLSSSSPSTSLFYSSSQLQPTRLLSRVSSSSSFSTSSTTSTPSTFLSQPAPSFYQFFSSLSSATPFLPPVSFSSSLTSLSPSILSSILPTPSSIPSTPSPPTPSLLSSYSSTSSISSLMSPFLSSYSSSLPHSSLNGYSFPKLTPPYSPFSSPSSPSSLSSTWLSSFGLGFRTSLSSLSMSSLSPSSFPPTISSESFPTTSPSSSSSSSLSSSLLSPFSLPTSSSSFSSFLLSFPWSSMVSSSLFLVSPLLPESPFSSLALSPSHSSLSWSSLSSSLLVLSMSSSLLPRSAPLSEYLNLSARNEMVTRADFLATSSSVEPFNLSTSGKLKVLRTTKDMANKEFLVSSKHITSSPHLLSFPTPTVTSSPGTETLPTLSNSDIQTPLSSAVRISKELFPWYLSSIVDDPNVRTRLVPLASSSVQFASLWRSSRDTSLSAEEFMTRLLHSSSRERVTTAFSVSSLSREPIHPSEVSFVETSSKGMRTIHINSSRSHNSLSLQPINLSEPPKGESKSSGSVLPDELGQAKSSQFAMSVFKETKSLRTSKMAVGLTLSTVDSSKISMSPLLDASLLLNNMTRLQSLTTSRLSEQTRTLSIFSLMQAKSNSLPTKGHLSTPATFISTWRSRTSPLASRPHNVSIVINFSQYGVSSMMSPLTSSVKTSVIYSLIDTLQILSSYQNMATLPSDNLSSAWKKEMIVDTLHPSRSSLFALKTSTTAAYSFSSVHKPFTLGENNISQTLRPREFLQKAPSIFGSSLQEFPNSPAATTTITPDESLDVATSLTKHETMSNVVRTFLMFSPPTKASSLSQSLMSASAKEAATQSHTIETSFRSPSTKGWTPPPTTVPETKLVHIRTITATIDTYQVFVIRSYKSSEISTVGTVWIPIDSCRCPFLVPGKEYLLMGQMTMVDSTRVGVKVRRDGYVEEWKGSLLRKLRAAKHRCWQEPTMRPTSLATTPIISSGGNCPPCRISKRRNKMFCQSDFAIRGRVVRSTFNRFSGERIYIVKVKSVYRSSVTIKKRQEVYALNDHCNCPNLVRGQQYVIMGKMNKIMSNEIRLLIPPRPYVKEWSSHMATKYKSISRICNT
ncbi:Papilin [Acropora cervicornis]|uniref:Papilin n=1 Tax=Acropora cervicornis TaxID=6130 RepID=A0AAD9VBB3_ACRCE|nr:Papilin [Acropora cervicornis]